MLEPKSSRNYCRISTIGSLPERGLVGDDELVNREVLGRLLQGNGNAAEPVGSGQPALVKLKLHPFGFVLLDVLVPQMDGFEFLQRIRESFSVSELLVVSVTAEPERGRIVQAFRGAEND